MTNSDDLRTLIAELRARHAASTTGEWKALGGTYFATIFSGNPQNQPLAKRVAPKDAEFIVSAHNALPRLLDALEALLAVGTEDEYKAWVKSMLPTFENGSGRRIEAGEAVYLGSDGKVYPIGDANDDR